tara:strand:+ start:1417 stop:1692 length:276 start_codon:yes stop_codon:yes gene_type:complete
MKNLNSFHNNDMLVEGIEYTVGINDGRSFGKIVFKGTTVYNGKAMMRFETKNGRGLTINPSYHSFTLEEEYNFPTPDDLNYKEEDNNGKTI